MNTLKEILPYYLNTGVKMQTCINIEGNPVIEELTIDYLKSMIDEPIGELPLLRTFDSLKKTITVEGYNDGKPFVPVEEFEIGEENNGVEYDHGNIKLIRCLESIAKHGLFNDIEHLPFGVVQLLLKWHFNVFNLPTDQFIEIKD